MPFMKKFIAARVTKKIMTKTLTGHQGSVMHRFYVAYIVNELVSSKIRTE